MPISAKVEADIAELAEMDPDEAKEYMEALGLSESGLARLIREAYHLLGLQSYFTSGETETRAWTIPVGAKAPAAAGVIHSDFERGFIEAETASFEDYVACHNRAGFGRAGHRLGMEPAEEDEGLSLETPPRASCRDKDETARVMEDGSCRGRRTAIHCLRNPR